MSEQPQQPQQASAQNGAPPLDPEGLQQALSESEARAAENKDLYYRALAELENVRKRAARDIEQAHKFALERFAGELVGVKDSLELALANGPQTDAKSLLEGSEATLKLLAKAFEKSGVEEIDPAGQPFNPELHEAMVMQESSEVPPNHVLQVVQKGYRLNGRLLRPARVIVARAAVS
ncbi:MAG TPA: nucleotide exchange factor GrpE [Steroidobacteraceae bacterium]|nr:nucleotide exchange factor GrpE [Steroidobacteraceae bacterium]